MLFWNNPSRKKSFKEMGGKRLRLRRAEGPPPPFLWKNFFLEGLFQKSVLDFLKTHCCFLRNRYFAITLKCIDAKFAAALNQLFSSNCIAHSNQSTQLSFTIYQNVFSRKNNFIVKDLILVVLLLYDNYKIFFSCGYCQYRKIVVSYFTSENKLVFQYH